jgi:DTW domain-containing protein YfiP
MLLEDSSIRNCYVRRVMTSTKRGLNKTKDPILRQYEGRCGACYMRVEKCICEIIPTIENQTYLTVIMHHRESYKTTNTARLACMALQNSRIVLRGEKDKLTPLELKTDRQPLLLTLAEPAQVLTTEFAQSFKKPIELIVPDGNWRQANKMGKREPALKNVPWVKLLPGPKSVYQLRHEHHPEGLSTLEAIARAFAAIESPAIEENLMKFFKIMVSRTLETRPKNRVARPPV